MPSISIRDPVDVRSRSVDQNVRLYHLCPRHLARFPRLYWRSARQKDQRPSFPPVASQSRCPWLEPIYRAVELLRSARPGRWWRPQRSHWEPPRLTSVTSYAPRAWVCGPAKEAHRTPCYQERWWPLAQRTCKIIERLGTSRGRSP